MDSKLNNRYMNLLKSEPEAIEQFLDTIHNRYGSFESFLSEAGINIATQVRIVEKFTSL